MPATFDVLVASSIKRKDGVIVAGRLNFNGTWIKRLMAAKKGVTWLAPLATLKKLKVTSPNLVLDDDVLEKVVFSGYLHQLEELDGLPRKWLARLAKSKKPWALERIRLSPGSPDDKKERPALDAAFASGKGLPALTDLALTWSEHGPGAFKWVFESATGNKLEALRINSSHFGKDLVAWQRAVDKAGAKLALQEIEMYTGSTTVSLLRKPGGGWRLIGDMTKDQKTFYGVGARHLNEALATLKVDEVDIAGYQRS